MQRTITLVLCTALGLCLATTAWSQTPRVEIGKAIHHDTSAPQMPMAAPMATKEQKIEIPIMQKPNLGRFPDLAEPDGGLQPAGPENMLGPLAPTPPPLLSVPGLSEQDNLNTVGIAVVPPDTNGDIGFGGDYDGDGQPDKVYVQYINLVWGVFDDTGNLIFGPFAGNSFWTGFGGFCESNNDGDPIVLYDDQAGRWFFSQFSIGEGIQCVAISTTSDPLGTYHRYAFTVTPGGQNDYPKIGVWDDGGGGQSAYTFTTRDFGGAGGPFSVGAGVMERDAMLAGLPASFIKFINPCVSGECIEGQLPPHLAGSPAPAGTCPTFWTAYDAAFDDGGFLHDGYRNHTLCVDWDNLSNSTYTEGPIVAAGSNFDRFLGNGFGNCITPVQDGEALDCLAVFTMYRAQYRWFPNGARVVLNTTVDAGGDRGGIRWAEIHSGDGQSGWSLRQDGTYAPDDGVERWMGSIAQDGDGNIALGYSAASSTLLPAVRYVTRSPGDPAGMMAGGEVSCHEGTGAQIASANRWGDYSSMSVDPEDDCTFWFTQEYYQTTGSWDFNTRICAFTVEGCGEACVPNEPGTELSCADGLDNDCDLEFDCFDSDCNGHPACACVPQPEICTDGLDNDCDGLVDCDDPDCALEDACYVPQPPENDLCLNAIELTCPAEGGSTTVSGTTIDATLDGAGFCGTSNTAPGVWYSIAFDGLINASTCNAADYDTKLSVYDGECGALGCITGRDDTPGCSGFTTEVDWISDGSENLILVHGFAAATGNFNLTVTCELPAAMEVVKVTTEGDEDIGQFPLVFELFAPGQDPATDVPVETQTLGTGGGSFEFTTELDRPGTWTVVEVLPSGWYAVAPQVCEKTVAFPQDGGATLTCSFENVELSRVEVLKLTDGVPTTDQTWNFDLYSGPDGFNGTLLAADSTPPTLLDFGLSNLVLIDTYTVCELSVPAGWSTFWQVDTTGDGVADTTVLPYNPNADDPVPSDVGNRCVDFGAGTAYELVPGTTLHFEVNNESPGGNPRSPGYWKNWNTCTNGKQAENAAMNGGWEEGFWILDDVLDPDIGGGIIWDDMLADNLELVIDDCDDAVNLLDKRDLRGRKKASDPLFNLASHLLASQLNFGAGACTTPDVLDAALEAELLLDEYDFDGRSHDLRKRDPGAERARDLATYLDEYNNGAYCGDFTN